MPRATPQQKPAPVKTRDELIKHVRYDQETGNFYRSDDAASIQPIGHIAKNGYKKVSIKGYPHLAHRIAWLYMTGDYPQLDVDHIDGDRTNNAWSNLREGTRAQNLQNRRSVGCTKRSCDLLGAFWSKAAGRWRSQIRAGGRVHHLGLFDTAEEAHMAYVAAKRRLHEFCVI